MASCLRYKLPLYDDDSDLQPLAYQSTPNISPNLTSAPYSTDQIPASSSHRHQLPTTCEPDCQREGFESSSSSKAWGQRSILNADQVLRWCNSWIPTGRPGARGPWRKSESRKETGSSDSRQRWTASNRTFDSVKKRKSQRKYRPRGGRDLQSVISPDSGWRGWRNDGLDGAGLLTATRQLQNENDPIIGADCIGFNFENLTLSAALMKEADVLIGVHG